MRMIFLVGMIITMFGCKPSKYLQNTSVQLSNPKISIEDVFFEGSTVVSIAPTAKNAKIVYFDSNRHSQKYGGPIIISESTQITAQAIGGGFIPSDSVSIEVLKLPKNEIISITSERDLNEKYDKGGLDILINRKKGSRDFNNGWLGYSGDTIVYHLEFDIIDVDHLVISTLRDQRAWIFTPAQINVYLDGELVRHSLSDGNINESGKANIYTRIDIPRTTTRQLKVEVIAPKEIPNWHPGAGNKPWIFIDEILIY